MKKIELIWNIVYYFVWKFDYKAHLFFNKINPFMLLHKLPFQRRMYERKGINIYNEINYAFKNPRYGLSIMRSGSFMFILSMLIGLEVFCIIQSIYAKKYLSTYVFIISALPFIVFTYFLLIYKDKYLIYFKEFEVKSKAWKTKWGFISFGIVLTIILLVFICFKIMDYSLNPHY